MILDLTCPKRGDMTIPIEDVYIQCCLGEKEQEVPLLKVINEKNADKLSFIINLKLSGVKSSFISPFFLDNNIFNSNFEKDIVTQIIEKKSVKLLINSEKEQEVLTIL